MSDVIIKTLPRTNDKAVKTPSKESVRAEDKRNLAKVFIGLSVVAFAMGALGFWTSLHQPVERQIARAAPPPVDRVGASITRHMYDTHLMELMMKRKSLLENQAAKHLKKGEAAELDLYPVDNRSYGVHMDQEDTAERLYKDLKIDKSYYGDNIEEKVNSKLANRKWLNEMERAERLNFVKTFIRQAYERGYEVQLDENLVVVGVRRVTKKVDINQVLDKLAKQGH